MQHIDQRVVSVVRYIWRVFIALWFVCEFSRVGGDVWAASGQTERAISSTRVMVSAEARHEFISRVETFAKRESFVTRKGQPRGDSVHFLIEMERGDIKLTVLNPYDDPTEFDCFIYQAKSELVPLHVVEAIWKKFVEDVGLIAGVSIMHRN